MRRQLLCLCVLVIAGTGIPGCGGEKKIDVGDEETLAAKVEEWTLSKELLYEYIDQLPDAQKMKYDTPGGRSDLAAQFMADEFFYLEAQRLNMTQEEDVKKMIDEATRRILVQAYYRDYVNARARPSKEEMLEYYESRKDVYSSLPVARAQHIFSTNKEKLEDLKTRIIEGGEKLTTLAHKYSEDKLTRPDGGNLGYFNPGGYIRGVGFSETLSDTIFKMEPKKVYGPIEWEKGYSLIRVNEKRPAEVKPFPEVQGEISELLTKQRIDQAKRDVVSEVRDRYDWRNYMEEYYRKIQRTPEELFEYAQNTDDPYERIRTFEEIFEKFPEDEHAPQAMFMIGFVYAEELSDRVSAERAFIKVVAKYPDSDVADSARWMLDNIGTPLPEFEDIDDLNKKLSGESD
jgi:peptidyl-prolyl cis-trans isomerase C